MLPANTDDVGSEERDVSLALARLTIMLYDLQYSKNLHDSDTSIRNNLCPFVLMPACFPIVGIFNGIEYTRRDNSNNDGGDDGYTFTYVNGNVRTPFTLEHYPKTPWIDEEKVAAEGDRRNQSKEMCLYVYKRGKNSGERCTTRPMKGTYCAKHKKYQK